MLRERYDFVGRIDLVKEGETMPAPIPGIVPASITPEGYLEADALLARDGLLTYSDGKTEWTEYRPRAELEAAIPSFSLAPITDDHPAKMLDAKTWSKFARGIGHGNMTIEVHNGTAYQRERLRIADAELVRKIQSGEQCEVSIGFVSDVVPTDGQFEGIKCDAVQTKMTGNHKAIVVRGRAGPICRVMLDSAAICVYAPEQMADTKPTNVPVAKKDNTGPGTEQVEYTMPDGTVVMLPTMIVAMLQELQALKAAAAGGGDATKQTAPQQPTAPVAPVVAAAPAVPAQPVPDGKDEDKEDPVEDAINVFKPIRRRLERLAGAAGVEDAILDSEDPRPLAKAYIAKVMPTAKLDSFDAKQLAALVETASTLPKQEVAKPDRSGPWGGGHGPQAPRKREDKEDKDDAEKDPRIEFLARQGYG